MTPRPLRSSSSPQSGGGSSRRSRRRQRGSLTQSLLLLLAVLAAGAVAGWVALTLRPSSAAPLTAGPAEEKSPGRPAAAEELSTLGRGFVVWESRRSGDWRLWIRDFDGSEPRQLTEEPMRGSEPTDDSEATDASEPTRQHCCAHLSPDGRRLLYMSLAKGEETYPEDVADGELRLRDLESGEERVLVEGAQTYYEHRAAVWKDDSSVIYIGSDGRTRLLSLQDGSQELLTAEARLHQNHGWLINPTFTHAVTGLKTSFSPYDPETRHIGEVRAFGGCQGYFSQDGRWGFWAGGAGGPLKALDLTTREVVTVVEKSDPRLPADRGYLYFPNLSPDGMLFTFAASHDEHHHFEGNYDVFVARLDPGTFQLLGDPLQITTDPGTDRFPDVFHVPLDLGRHDGEAPLTVDFRDRVEDPAAWTWSYGAGAEEADGSPGTARFSHPGTYEVRARRGDRELLGQVLVRPARPPRVLEIHQQGEEKLALRFDEAVALDDLQLRFASGREIAGWEPEGETGLVIHLAGALDAADTLVLEGVRDRAQEPNTLAATEVAVDAPRWPSDRDGLVFLWRDGNSPNRIADPVTGEESSCLLETSGIAWLDHHYRMVLRRGAFTASDGDAARIVYNCKKTNHLSLELTVAPHRQSVPKPARILSLAGPNRVDVVLEQRGGELFLRLRTPENGLQANEPAVELGAVPAREPSHLVVTYSPGRLRTYLDGVPVLDTDILQGGFFNWKYRPLHFGSGDGGSHPWAGVLEGVAVYNRVLEPAEVAENHRRYAAERAARKRVPKVRFKARLTARSEAPTLEQIAPYREALTVYEYEVLEVLGGSFDGERVRVAHTAILDRQLLPILRREPGSTTQLLLEPFGDNPQVESWFISDTLEPDYSIPLYYDVGR
ncbi:MAG: LamG-like jellyroll fold domain-containing protein [Acidobacteriota bacterium]|nr:LamG-like jellyroll fold domain-containing protein [Acidobacteriota bacterium]